MEWFSTTRPKPEDPELVCTDMTYTLTGSNLCTFPNIISLEAAVAISAVKSV